MYKKLIFITLVVLLLPPLSFASDDDVKALLAKIVGTHAATPENEAWLTTLFDHADQGVRNSAKQRVAALYWKTGRYEKAEEILNELSASYDEYSPQYKVESLLTWSTLEFRRNNYIASEEYARKASDVARLSYPDLLGNTYYLLGNALQYQKKFVIAKQVYEQALDVYEEQGNGKGTLLVLNSLGLMFKNNGDLVLGTQYLLQAREAVEAHGSKSYRASVYYNLGDIFLQSQEPEKAIEYFAKAQQLDEELGDIGSVAVDMKGIAAGYLKMEEYLKALSINQQAIQQLLKITTPKELSQTYLQQSRIYDKLADEQGRAKSLQLARQSAEQSDSPYQIMSVRVEQARYSLDQENYQAALDELIPALKVATELSLEQNLMEITKLLAGAYTGVKDYEKAHFHLNESVELTEKLNTEDQREKLERYKRDVNLLEEKLKVTELEKSEAEQAKVLETQAAEKQVLMIVLVAVAIVFVALTFLLVQRRKLASIRADLFEKALQQKQELFADVSHELRTPLSALKLQIQALQYDIVSDVEDSYDKLDRKVNEINNLISDIYQLAQADTHALELNLEEEALHPLFETWQGDWQGLVEGSGYSWQCQLALADVKKSLDAERIKQVIDNLLSNAISYTDQPGTISLSAGMKDSQLEVSIEDTAPTVSKDKLTMIFTRLYRVESSRSRQTGGSGLGLAICESLIKAHGGSIKAEQSSLGGLKVTFTI
ncbi:tetratricopeptide repeat protein [Thalassotalea euphylliae]|uniref:tetratricopeptide repeat protein n=1 Tax=Thalassotalea euphylliae TaxID=1655234 RepID=UPI0036423A3A